MTSYKVLTTDESGEWNKLVERCQNKDIHFLAEYVALFERYLGEKSYLFVFQDEDGCVLYPFFKRNISKLPFVFGKLDREYYDIVSPWYFGGPIFWSKEGINRASLADRFLRTFGAWCIENNIVSEFARLHPILKNHEFLGEKCTSIMEEYDVAYVNLEQSEDRIWKNFTKANRNAVTKAARFGVTVECGGKELIGIFYRFYEATMKRHSASKFYFFPLEFFERMFEIFRDNAIIFVAKHCGRPIAASLFLYKYDIVHYWLSGSDSEYWKFSPNNILIYRAMLWSKRNGNKIFFLMGGDNPQLRKFKLSFTNTTAKFYTYRKIHDEKTYKMLCDLRDACAGYPNPNIKYFPYYRR